MGNIESHDKELSLQMSRGLEQIKGVTTYGIGPEDRIALQCFNVDDIPARAKQDRSGTRSVFARFLSGESLGV